MLKQVLLFVAFCGFVVCQDVKKNDTKKTWFPFLQEKQDAHISPQMTIEERTREIDETIKSPFVEDFPPGQFRLNDAVLMKDQEDRLFKEITPFAIIRDEKLRWTDAIIPYHIDCSIEKLDNAVYAIKAAMREWERKTCIRFKPRTTEKKYLRFIRDTHCWGHVGMNDYSTISCGFGCEQQNVMSHEIGHAVGFYHEQNRNDRDSAVTIMWDNIGQFKSAFEKVKNTYSMGVPYDYASIMHYPWTAFSSNGQATMRPLRNTGGLQPYVQISQADIRQTSLMYKCGGRYRVDININDEIEKELRKEGIDPSIDLFNAGCADQSRNCKAWKDAGYCVIYSHVKNLCPTSCRLPKCTGGESCGDSDQHCRAWSKQGFCETSSYVKKNCCKSCGGKTKPPTPPPPTPPPPTTTTKRPEKECTNKEQYCTEWAKSGYCGPDGKYATFMDANCCAACKELNKKPCKDRKTYCKTWADLGYCKATSIYQGFMKDHCCLACRGGKPRPTEPPTVKPVTSKPVTEKPDPSGKDGRVYLGTGVLCEDTRQDCAQFARRGDCTRNRPFMEYYCKKSCRMTNCDQPGKRPKGSCAYPLGLSYKSRNYLPDHAFKSAYGHLSTGGWNAYPYNARLYFPDQTGSQRIGAWCADTGKTSPQRRQSLTIDLQSQKSITHIATQGRDKYWERISEFKIEYSTDGQTFYPYKENGKVKIFTGSCDYRTPVLNKFSPQIVARFVKYIPWKWNYPCVRMEFYGC